MCVGHPTLPQTVSYVPQTVSSHVSYVSHVPQTQRLCVKKSRPHGPIWPTEVSASLEGLFEIWIGVATAYDVIVMPNTRVMFSSAATSRGFLQAPQMSTALPS